MQILNLTQKISASWRLSFRKKILHILLQNKMLVCDIRYVQSRQLVLHF